MPDCAPCVVPTMFLRQARGISPQTDDVRLDPPAEEHFKSLLEEEEAGRREREQQAKLQEERDAARREKRKAKAKKKKGKAGKGTASQERPPPQPGEAVSADVEQVSVPRAVPSSSPHGNSYSRGSCTVLSMACQQEDEEPPASAADVASSSAVAPAASGSAVKSAGPTPRSLREEEEAAFNAGSDGDGDGDAGPGEDTLLRLVCEQRLKPLRASCNKVAAKAQTDAGSKGRMPCRWRRA